MKKNIGKELKNTKGITLVALVVTLIVLLILAGVSIGAVIGNQGIFKKAEQAADVYNREKAREKLELTLSDAQVIKYTEGLTDEQLTNKINEIGEEIEEREVPEISQAIVDGYIFSVDRTVPKILDYLGKADGVIITARVSNNDTDGWVSAEESEAQITGTIKTYSGGKITETSAKVGSTTIPFTIDENGKYTINNITESGIYTIYAKDNKGKDKTKEIEVKVRVDKTAPTVETITATTDGNKIKLSATGHDKDEKGEEQSGIKEFSYTITPAGATPETGTFNKNETTEITVTNWIVYTIKVTATDKCGNINETGKEITVDMRDTVGPTFTSIKAEAEAMTIKISVDATDDKSGLQSLNYSVTPSTISTVSGVLEKAKEIELTATAETTYTITFTATDKVGNKTNKALTAKTVDGLTIAQAKEKVKSYTDLQKYIGTKIVDYKPSGDSSGVYRLFYYDKNNTFGGGNETLYLKRDAVSIGNLKTSDSTIDRKMMWQLNIKWKAYVSQWADFTRDSEKYASWLCAQDGVTWSAYCDDDKAKFVVGTPSLEMFCAAYNTWKTGSTSKPLSTKLNSTAQKYCYGYILCYEDWDSSNENNNLTPNGSIEGRTR